MKTLIVIFILAFGALLMWFTVSAHALGMCGNRADFIKALNDKFQERGVAMALTGYVNVVELLRTKTGSTWTLIITTTDGKTCIFAAGQNWKDLIPESEGKPL